MNHEEMKELVYQNAAWLSRNIAPDDIYIFAEQCIIACQFFITELNEHVDLHDQCMIDKTMAGWVKNIGSLLKLRSEGYEGGLDVSYMENE